MLRAIFRLFVLSEAIVGTALLGLLLLGRTDPMFVVNTLTVVGVGVLAFSAAPSMMNSAVQRRGGPMIAEDVKEGSSLRGTATRLKPSGFIDRFGHVIRGILMAGIVIGTGLLLYSFPLNP
jgi:hypothetical protein